MPDYTYHPFLKHLLFRLPAEESRRLTLGLLEFQSRIAAAKGLCVPAGIALRGSELESAVAHDAAAFFTLPSNSIENSDALKRLRSATARPLLLRLDPEWNEVQLDAAIDSARRAGLN